jgi:hypothetical protein
MTIETLCAWKSGDDGDALDECEECGKTIPKGGDVHFIADGGYSPDGNYIGACCINWPFDFHAAAIEAPCAEDVNPKGVPAGMVGGGMMMTPPDGQGEF